MAGEDRGAARVVVLSDIVPRLGWFDFVHNGQPVYLKWLLLFEPRVLANVPFRLE